MKKNYLNIHHILCMMMLLMALASCSDKSADVDISPGLNIEFAISDRALSFSASSDLTQTVKITANTDWKLLSGSDDEKYAYDSWIDITVPTSNSTESDKSEDFEVTIEVEANMSVAKRSTTIYFGLVDDSDQEPISLTITQDANTSGISLEKGDIWFSSTAAATPNLTQEINVIAGCNWRVLDASDGAEYAYGSWITDITKSGSGNAPISITVAEATSDFTDYARNATIYIIAEGAEVKIENTICFYVNQFSLTTHHISSPNMIDAEVHIDYDGTAQEFPLITSYNWGIPAASETNDLGHLPWVKLSAPADVNNNYDVLTISCEPNRTGVERTSILYVNIIDDNGNTHTYNIGKIIQPADPEYPSTAISLDLGGIWFSPTPAATPNLTQEINVTASCNWRVLDASDGAEYAYDSWVTNITKSGSGNAPISITVAEATADFTDYGRTTAVYMIAEGLELKMENTICFYVNQFSLATHHISSPNIGTDGKCYINSYGTAQEYTLITSYNWGIPAASETNDLGHLPWVKLSAQADSNNNYDVLTISCDPNDTGVERTSILYVNIIDANGYVHTYNIGTIVQAASSDFSLPELSSNINIDCYGAPQTLSLTSTEKWEIQDIPSWLNVSPTSGDSSQDITFSSQYTEFSRSANISIKLIEHPNTLPVTYEVNQEGINHDNVASATLSETALEFGVSGASQTINITSDIPWKILTSTDGEAYTIGGWISLDKTSGDSGTQTLIITAKQNPFNISRSTSFYVVQPDKTSPIASAVKVTISQIEDEDSKIASYEYLGVGYNSAGGYASSSETKERVLDCDKLEAAGLISTITYYKKLEYSSKIYESTSEIQEDLNISAGANVAYNGFTSEINSKYGQSVRKYAETKYGKKTATYRYAEISTMRNITTETLQSCVLPTVLEKINNPNISPEQIISDFGTHVILGYLLGGKYEYTTSALRSASDTNTNFEIAISAGYDDGLANTVSGNTSTSSATSVKNTSFASEEQFVVSGGTPSTNMDTWSTGLLTNRSFVMVDYAGDGIFPIWELATDPGRQSDLENAANTYAVEVTSGSVKGLYNYEFWLGNLTYYGNDPGNAEINIDLSAHIIEGTQANHHSVAYTPIWKIYMEDFIDDGNANNSIAKSAAGDTGNNLYTTGEIFIGGSGQYEIALKLYLDEGDTNDSKSTNYIFYRTKQNFGGGEVPFWYISTEDYNSAATPFASIDSGNGWYWDTYWSNTLEWLTGTTYFNGKTIRTTTNDEDDYWMYSIYYRDISTY